MNEIIEEKLKLLPDHPGVYKMYNSAGEVIYVGKAVNLKNRVRQYFHHNKQHTVKVRSMVEHIADFDTIAVRTETEALSLESNLIKEFKPKYNILLKDDKHFPYIRIDESKPFPRIETVRKIKADGAKYIGPFLSATILRENMDVIRDYFPTRHCKKDISLAIARRERPCLMHQIGKCCAPCSGEISPKTYLDIVKEAEQFLSGNTDAVLKRLTEQMNLAAEQYEYEKAAQLRDSIKAIRMLSEKQTVIDTNHLEAHVFGLYRAELQVMIYCFFVRDGKVIGSEKFSVRADSDESDGAIMETFLQQYYTDFPIYPPEILLSTEPEDLPLLCSWLSELRGKQCSIHVPVRGNKAKIVQLAVQNAKETFEKDQRLKNSLYLRNEGALQDLMQLLHLERLPMRMECFDNSHIQGTDTVAGMVVFTGSKPDKKAYRHFKIRSEAGGNDLIAMQEVLMRRFTKALNHETGFDVLPDLLIVDGGKEQLRVANEVLDVCGLTSIVPSIGLAELNEYIYLSPDSEPIILARDDPALQLLQRIRDEAHRFAITYHRSVHRRNALYSRLDEIPGIGEKRKRALFDRYITVEEMKNASIEELRSISGMNAASAQAVYRFFHETEI